MIHNNISTAEVNGFGQDSKFKLAAPNLWWVYDAFNDDSLNWLQSIYVNTANKFEVSRPHNRLLLANGVDQKKLQAVGRSLIPELEKMLSQKLNLMVSKFWLDLPNFGCQPHGDSAEIIVTLQIYVDVKHLKDHETRLYGAEFMHVEPTIEAPIVENCGYLNLNTDQKVHRVVGGCGTRQSVAFQYNLATDS
jgi:hypothetical protein|tara:strand:- start:290 stop:865 length:576 start_codon:yes stop_codon:yes gene_type:complete